MVTMTQPVITVRHKMATVTYYIGDYRYDTSGHPDIMWCLYLGIHRSGNIGVTYKRVK